MKMSFFVQIKIIKDVLHLEIYIYIAIMTICKGNKCHCDIIPMKIHKKNVGQGKI